MTDDSYLSSGLTPGGGVPPLGVQKSNNFLKIFKNVITFTKNIYYMVFERQLLQFNNFSVWSVWISSSCQVDAIYGYICSRIDRTVLNFLRLKSNMTGDFPYEPLFEPRELGNQSSSFGWSTA